MRRSGSHTRIGYGLSALVALAFLAQGCAMKARPNDKPTMVAGSGAISGKLLNADSAPFDLALLGDESPVPLQIELVSPDRGVVAASHPREHKPQFAFSDVPPGAYELSIYRAIPGKRTIAASQPVTVNAGEITPVKLTLQVSEERDSPIAAN